VLQQHCNLGVNTPSKRTRQKNMGCSWFNGREGTPWPRVCPSVREAGGIRGAPLFLWGMCTCYLCKRVTHLTNSSRLRIRKAPASIHIHTTTGLLSDPAPRLQYMDGGRGGIAGEGMHVGRACVLTSVVLTTPGTSDFQQRGASLPRLRRGSWNGYP
jgi:hypothetical protein